MMSTEGSTDMENILVDCFGRLDSVESELGKKAQGRIQDSFIQKHEDKYSLVNFQKKYKVSAKSSRHLRNAHRIIQLRQGLISQTNFKKLVQNQKDIEEAEENQGMVALGVELRGLHETNKTQIIKFNKDRYTKM